MTYNTIKRKYNSDLLQACVLKPNQCKFTTPEFVAFGSVTLGSTILIGDGPGATITISGGEATKFTATSYLAVNDEIIRVTVDSDIQLTIQERAQFGTVAAAHAISDPAQVKHSGEVDGSCYGHPETCSDPNSFQADTTYDLIFGSQTIPQDIQGWSGLQRVSFSDPEVDPGESMGKRGKCTVTILDSIDDSGSWDKITVPYEDRRTTLGTRFKKLAARSVWLENRDMQIWNGFQTLPVDLNNFLVRNYVIDSFQINDDNTVTLTGLDPLILTEDKKSKAPVESQGKLATQIVDASTDFTLVDALNFEYGLLGETVYIRFDSEVIQCEVTGALTFDILQRNFKQPGTQKKDHEINTTAQAVIAYENVHVVDIITDLLTNYTKTPAAFIGDYTDTKNLIPTVLLTGYLSKPKAVKDLINELIKHGDLIMWFDQELGQIQIKTVPEFNAEAIEFNEATNIGIDTFQVKRNLDVQFTRAPVYWGSVDITKDSGEENFAIGVNIINTALEFDDGLADTNSKKELFSRWLENTLDQNQIGSAISNRMVSRANNPPLDVTFDVDMSDVGELEDGQRVELGTILNVSTAEILDVTGAPTSQLYQVLKLNQTDESKYNVKARLYQLPVDTGSFDFVISESKEDYDLSTEFAPASGVYSILIEAGVTIGQVNATDAFTTGPQAAGVSFNIVNRGRILGRGGNGGNAATAIAPNPADLQVIVESNGDNGTDGGDALNITVPTTIDNGSGFIFGGGGGCGGSASSADSIPPDVGASAGNGGSGGQGYIGGTGGSAGFALVEDAVSDSGQPGQPGSINAPGVVGSRSGGAFGEDGDDGAKIATPSPGGDGGLSGFAIKSNGNSVTITSGDTVLNIKGRRDF